MRLRKFTLVLLVLFISQVLSKEKIRGVNLGGWLLLEPWITPNLFSQFENLTHEQRAVDESTFNQRLGPQEAKRQLEIHWSTWVQEEDFKKIHDYGLSHVRIPLGWWIFGDNPNFAHNISHLERGLDLAAKYGIKVLLELHGAPGSQNGFDNSGIACKSTYEFMEYGCMTNCQEKTDWIENRTNLELTQKILTKIADKYKDNPVVWGLGFVNEPFWLCDLKVLKEWYEETYHLLREMVPDWILIMDTSFRPFEWENFMNDNNKYRKVVLDTHIYVWPFTMEKEPNQILENSCLLVDQIHKTFPSIIGEWSLGIDDCGRWLTGFLNTPKRSKIGSGCERNLPGDFYRNFAKNQLWAYEQAEGWFFWNFKNELEDNWSWFKMVENGWVPRNAREIPDFIKDCLCISNKANTEL